MQKHYAKQKPIFCQNNDTVSVKVIDFTLFKGWEKAGLYLLVTIKAIIFPNSMIYMLQMV